MFLEEKIILCKDNFYKNLNEANFKECKNIMQQLQGLDNLKDIINLEWLDKEQLKMKEGYYSKFK